jgi:hypothetical protein
MLVGGGVTSAVPTARGLGGSVRMTTWLEMFDGHLGRQPEPAPFLGMTTGGDVGEFGWRFLLEANLGVAFPLAEAVVWHARVGLAPVALGHRQTDPDPDAWFGFSTSATMGMLFGPPQGGIVVGFEGAIAQDVAYAVPGSGTYLSALVTIGFRLGSDVTSR